MKKKINIGILGCANIAKRYVINVFKSLDVINNIYIACRNSKEAKVFAEKYNIIAEKSYDSIIDNKDIDAVYVPLPIGLHEKWVIKAAIARKHILCEKSLSNSFKSVKKMVGSCRSSKVVLFENFMCDYHPQHEKVLSLIHTGKIGDIFTFKGYFGFPPLDKGNFRYNKKLGGGSLNDAGAYPVFMARKILESEPISVTCRFNIDHENKVDIQGAAYIEFPNNKLAFVAFGFNNVYQNDYSVWGTKGVISVNKAYSIPPDFKPEVKMYKNENFKDVIVDLDIPASNHFELIFKDFCNVILNNDYKKRIERYNQIINQAKVLEAMRVSALEDRKVKIDEIEWITDSGRSILLF